MTKLNTFFICLFAFLLLSVTAFSQDDERSGREFPHNPLETSAPAGNAPTDKIIGSSSDFVRAYYEEGFESLVFPPTGWQAIDVLGAKTWVRSTSQAKSGVASAYMAYEYTGGEDWLITPKWAISAGDSLVFWARKYFTTSYPPDFLEVRVSATDSALASFTTMLHSVDVNALIYGEWNRIAVPLNAYAGQLIYIAFKHYDTNGNGVYIDDIVVGVPAPNDVGMFSVDVPSPMLPGSMTPKATVKNYGSATQSFPVTMTVTPGSYSSTKTVTDLAPGAVYQVSFDNWNPTIGVYTVGVTTNLPGDANVNNNYMQKSVSVTNAGWTGGAPIPVGGYMGTGASYMRNDTGFIFAAGGNTTLKTDLQVYNVKTNTWSAKAPIPQPRVVTSSAVIGNTLYLVGGSDGAATPAYVNTLFAYDILSNTWSTKANLPVNRGWLKSVAYQDSLIYMAGGYDGSSYQATVYVYNINTNSWRAATSMPSARIGGAFGVFGDRLVYVGGADATTVQSTTFVGTINQSDRSQISWTTGAAYPGGARFRWDAAYWGNDGIIFAGGSPTTDWAGTNNGYIYKPETNTWTVLPALKTSAALGSYVGTVHYSNNDAKFVMASGYHTPTLLTVTEMFNDNIAFIPVELASFKANVYGNSVTLNWITVTETNNSGFEVERSFNGSTFENIAFLKGNGTTSEVSLYNFTDTKLANGTYSYRLKQVDFDGTFEYSNIVEVEVLGITSYSMEQNYPNPFNPSTSINFSLPVDSKVSLKVFDILGQEAAVIVNSLLTAGSHTYNFDASSLNSGVYFYQIEAQGSDGSSFKTIKKMMLTK